MKPLKDYSFSYYETVTKTVTPGDIYGPHLEKIPNIIGDIWEIIDFRPPRDEDWFILAAGLTIGQNYGPCENKYSRFIVRKKRPITDKERLEWLLTRYNKEREFYGVLIRPVAVEDIDNEIRKETK